MARTSLILNGSDGEYEFDLKNEGFTHSFDLNNDELIINISAAGPKNPPSTSPPSTGNKLINLEGTIKRGVKGKNIIEFKNNQSLQVYYETTGPLDQPNNGMYILKIKLPVVKQKRVIKSRKK